jgi:MipA family protein
MVEHTGWGMAPRRLGQVIAVLACGLAATDASLAQLAATPPDGQTTGAASADSAVPVLSDLSDQRLRYVVGLHLQASPAYPGASSTRWRLLPQYAVRLGRWRLSTSGMDALLGAAADAGSGASTDLFRGDRWAAGLGLRYDSGRKSSVDPQLAGLADIERTIRARLATRYALAPGWAANASISADLLGRGGGLAMTGGIGYGGRLLENTTYTAGVGVTAGDARYLQARFGVPAAGATASRPAYTLGAGPQDAYAGIHLATALSSRWVMLTDMGVSTVLGDAARSPLTERRTGVRFAVGLVWRGLN